jgi:hypothetical protein
MAGSAIQAVAGPKSIAARGTERYSCETHRPAHMPNGGSPTIVSNRCLSTYSATVRTFPSFRLTVKEDAIGKEFAS